MKKCPYCHHEFEGSPRYCPNCGRVNYDDVFLNMSLVQQSVATGKATQVDFDFIKAVQKDVKKTKQIDFRTPLEKFLDWPGWWLVLIITGALAIWGNLNTYLASLLLGISFSIVGLLLLRFGRGKGEIYAIIFLGGGVLTIGYSIIVGLGSLFTP